MTNLKEMTNEEFLIHMINHSSTGGLMQLFILEGAAKYAEAVLKEDGGVTVANLISPEAWRRCAEEYLDRVDEKYHPKAVKAEDVLPEGSFERRD